MLESDVSFLSLWLTVDGYAPESFVLERFGNDHRCRVCPFEYIIKESNQTQMIVKVEMLKYSFAR